MPDLSLIIVSRNVSALLDRCLASAKRDPLWRKGRMELLVVDNASGDGTAEMVRRRHPEARLIANRRNTGFAAACNQGLRASRGEFPAVLNADTVVLDGALTRLWGHARENPGTGIAGPGVLNPDGSPQPTQRRFPNYTNILFSRKSPISRYFPDNPWTRRCLEGPRLPDGFLHGVCYILNRRMLDGLGLFDEGYFMYMEDVDLCYRARSAGWGIELVPEARIVHYWGRSTVQEKRAMDQHHRRALYRYFCKHFRPNFLQRIYLWAGLTAHSLFY